MRRVALIAASVVVLVPAVPAAGASSNALRTVPSAKPSAAGIKWTARPAPRVRWGRGTIVIRRGG